ncbi:MAG: sulfite exporter TauE/SafE family protein [Planctomycetes bacterium]|nr:sulfite exporter TauE/SafE family protein [Planctomycetota bacterium]
MPPSDPSRPTDTHERDEGAERAPASGAFLPGTIHSRRFLATTVLPAVCALIVVVTVALAPGEQRAPILWSSLVAAASGFAATSIGVYGGVLVPGLLLLGIDARFVAAASLFLQVLVIPLGASAHARLGNIARHVAIPLIVGGVVGAFVGPACAAALPKESTARIVAGVIVLVGLLVLATLRFGGMAKPARLEDVSRSRIGAVGLVAGFASGVSGAGWGPIGVKCLLLLGIEPRQAIGSSLLGRVFMALSAVVGYLCSANALEAVRVEAWLLVPLFAGSLSTMVPGVFLVSRMQRERAVVLITLLSIALALPTLIRGQ